MNDCASAVRRELFGVGIDAVTMDQAIQVVLDWMGRPECSCPFVVTPNVDHVVQLYLRPELMDAYRSAALTIADGWPLVTASRLLGRPLPERVAGSDLLPNIMERCHGEGRPLRVFLMGGMPGVGERAAEQIRSTWSTVEVVGISSPPLGFESDLAFNQELVTEINDSQADLLAVGLGFPKQESWLANHRDQLRVGAAMGVGATIDFLAGEQVRAPRWVQSIRMEWLHRMLSDPKRLVRRYFIDGVYFPIVVARQALNR